PVDLTAAGDERHRLARVDAGLLGLRAGIDLHVEAQMSTLLPVLLGEFYDNLVPVYRLDHIETRYLLLRIVGLKQPDQMQLRVGKGLFECRPFGRRLLHAILTENAVTGLEYGADDLRAEGLGDGYERHRARRSARFLFGLPDTPLNLT